MTYHRRTLLAASLGLAGAAAVTRSTIAATAADPIGPSATVQLAGLIAALQPNSAANQTPRLQAAIDFASANNLSVTLPDGSYRVRDLRLRSNTRLLGTARSSKLIFDGGQACITADKADNLVLSGIVIDGAFATFNADRGEGLISITNSKNITIDDTTIRHSAKTGLSLVASSGRISFVDVHDVLDAGIKSLDAAGLDIHGVCVRDCGNNGILVWRSERGEDGTTVRGNRIEKIRNANGGSGEFGNGINVFRAGSVQVLDNRITDCAYSAVRGNAASNIQVVANSCERIGEVAIYSEFGFEGALIANNTITTAATGISVTNFNDGGRLAVIQGNLIRHLFRREAEPTDKRGQGIGVEADAVVCGNTIEGAPTVGIQIGWGPFMRDVAATGNVIRHCKVGISVTAHADAASCLIANNLISSAAEGAIRSMHLGILVGPDLAMQPSAASRVTVIGNVTV